MKTKVYGYCRVSTMKQSIERQIRNVKEKYPDAVIVIHRDKARSSGMDEVIQTAEAR